MTITKKTQLLFAKMVLASKNHRDRSAVCSEIEGMSYILLEDLSADSWYYFKNSFGNWLKSNVFYHMDLKQLANNFNSYLSEFPELKDSHIDLDADGKEILLLVDTIY